MAVDRNKPKLIFWAPELLLLRDARRIAAPQYDVVATTVPARALALLQRELLAAAILCEHAGAAVGKRKDKDGPNTTAVALLEAARLRRPDARRILLIHPDEDTSADGLATRLLHHGAVEAILHMPLSRKELLAALSAPRIAGDAGCARRAIA